MSRLKILPPLNKAFKKLIDPRQESGKRYPLEAVLMLSVSAMLCGASGPTSISEWGRSRSREELKDLGFRRGIAPCPATIFNIFNSLDSVAFEKGVRDYFKPVLEKETVLSVDGKTLRGSRDGDFPAVHLLSALGQETKVVFNECFVSHKTNETKVIVPLLSELSINGKVITADAIHTQKGFCEWVIDEGGDYLLTVKDNQKELKESLADCFLENSPIELFKEVEKKSRPS